MNRAAAGSTRLPSARWAEAERPAIVAALAIGVAALALRASLAPQFDGLDDLGYLEAAQRVSQGRPLDDMFPLFRTRIGMAYPLGWLLQACIQALLGMPISSPPPPIKPSAARVAA